MGNVTETETQIVQTDEDLAHGVLTLSADYATSGDTVAFATIDATQTTMFVQPFVEFDDADFGILFLEGVIAGTDLLKASKFAPLADSITEVGNTTDTSGIVVSFQATGTSS